MLAPSVAYRPRAGPAAALGVPDVETDLRRFLTCGVLAHGFTRVRCDGCGFERFVPFACKGRGFCPSCDGRRMAERAAHPEGANAGKRSADATAIGIMGQYIYINTRTDTVIVKMSRHGIEQDERETFRAMRSIANLGGVVIRTAHGPPCWFIVIPHDGVQDGGRAGTGR